MIVSLAFAALLTQSPKALPDHVRLVPNDQAAATLAERLRGIWNQQTTASGTPTRVENKSHCSTIVVIPVDPNIDPKMAIQPKDQANMPSFTGNEPCFNKVP